MTKPKTINEHLDHKHGERGTESRKAFSQQAERYFIASIVREARKRRGLTQEELASRLSVNRAYVSKVERAGSDIRLSTLRKIIEEGLGGTLRVEVDL